MKRRLMQVCLCMLLVQAVTAQTEKKPETKSINTYFNAEKKYLVLPVKNKAPKRNVELWVDGVMTRFFDMELADATPDWFAYIDIEQWKGKKVEVRVDKVAVDSKVFSPVQQSDEDTNTDEYHEKYRGQFHFSPKRGWTNDPNGMVYYNGEYHLFFQHNPYGTGWGNMTWGHAVSKDLVHWTEVGDALHPDQFGPVFSGSAVVDKNNTSGLGKDGKAPMVTFHTGARAWAQCLSWSLDGRHFTKLSSRAVVPRINKDNRDPKVIWHEPTKKWVMVFWVEREGGLHTMQFLTSPNLLDWTETSYVKGGTGDDRYLFECPEFYELPVEGTSEKKWILTGANSQYAIGSFDGKTFTPEIERLQGQHGRDFYAAQTFNNEPNGRRIEMGWWRTNTAKEGMIFNQSQSIPLEHKLVQTPEGPRLTRMPVKELEMLRNKSYKIGKVSLKDNAANPLNNINAELVEMRMQIEPRKAQEVTLTVRGVPVVYDVAKQELKVDGVTAPAPLQNGKLDLIVFADRIGLEIFANRGLTFMPVNINLSPDNKELALTAKGGAAVVANLTVYELKSIWK